MCSFSAKVVSFFSDDTKTVVVYSVDFFLSIQPVRIRTRQGLGGHLCRPSHLSPGGLPVATVDFLDFQRAQCQAGSQSSIGIGRKTKCARAAPPSWRPVWL